MDVLLDALIGSRGSSGLASAFACRSARYLTPHRCRRLAAASADETLGPSPKNPLRLGSMLEADGGVKVRSLFTASFDGGTLTALRGLQRFGQHGYASQHDFGSFHFEACAFQRALNVVGCKTHCIRIAHPSSIAAHQFQSAVGGRRHEEPFREVLAHRSRYCGLRS